MKKSSFFVVLAVFCAISVVANAEPVSVPWVAAEYFSWEIMGTFDEICCFEYYKWAKGLDRFGTNNFTCNKRFSGTSDYAIEFYRETKWQGGEKIFIPRSPHIGSVKIKAYSIKGAVIWEYFK